MSSRGDLACTEVEEIRALRAELEKLRAAFDDPYQHVPAYRQLCQLTEKLRERCMWMADRKRDCGAHYEAIEAVLHKANALTGQDIYGNFLHRM